MDFIKLLFVFDGNKLLTLVHALDVPDELVIQCRALAAWLFLICCVPLVLMWVGHCILYMTSTRYQMRQIKGLAVQNVILNLTSASRTSLLQKCVDVECEKIQQNPPWRAWFVPTICG